MKLFYPLCLIATAFCFAKPVAAQTVEVSGHYENNVVWDADTVKIIGDVQFDEARLVVSPGTYVEAQGNFVVQFNNSSLIARGSEDEKITFTAKNIGGFPNNGSGWKGLRFDGTDTTDSLVMDYCNVSYGTSSVLTLLGPTHCYITHSRFENNYNPVQEGGGIYANGPKLFHVEYNVFRNNRVGSGDFPKGGAIYIKGSVTPRIRDNEFVANEAKYGSAVCTYTTAAHVFNNYIHGNYGSTIYLSWWDLHTAGSIHDNLIVNNNGNGIVGGSSPNESSYYNNTIVNNYVDFDMFHGGIFTIGQQKIYNNIIFSNGTVIGFGEQQIYYQTTGHGGPTCFNNCVSYHDDTENIVYAEPLFVNPTQGLGVEYDDEEADWSLLPDSPCINAGSTEMSGYPSTDFNGNPRIVYGTIDIGAIEKQDMESVQEVENEIIISPNPGGDFIKINQDGKVRLTLYDAVGRMALSADVENESVSTGFLPSGLYIYNIVVDNKTFTGKWIKK